MAERLPVERLVHELTLQPLVRLLLLDAAPSAATRAHALDLLVNRSHTHTRNLLRARFAFAWKALSAHALVQHNTSVREKGRRLLRIMNVFMRRRNNVLILHSTLLHIYLGHLEEAFALLERFVVLHPFNEDAILLGYAGYLSFILWRKQCEHLAQEESFGATQSSSFGSLAEEHRDDGKIKSRIR
ncbi:hypothetical protein BC830DRAFT_72030 [Chytriomyces sp. MP71]|nr:hypothetical protein BC830DRAFT_72030 [Chytriomyces sp. MP71]